jgi:hypothetical protein
MNEKDHNALFYDLKALSRLEYVALILKLNKLPNNKIEKVGKRVIDTRKQATIAIKKELAKFVSNTKRLKNSLNDEN